MVIQIRYYKPSTYQPSQSKQPFSTHPGPLSSSLGLVPSFTRTTCSQVSVPALPVLSGALSPRPPPLRTLDPTLLTIQ